MSKKLPKENLKKISGGVSAGSKEALISSAKSGKKNVLDTDVTGKAPAKKNSLKDTTM